MSGLAPQIQGALLALGGRRQFPAGGYLLREGEQSDHVIVLLRGVVKVSAIAESVVSLLSIRVAGDIVGETAPLTGLPRTATVVACREVTAHTVRRVDFERFLERYPAAAIRMAAVISERLRWANARRADFTAFPAEVRLGRLFVDLAGRCGRQVDGGILIDVPISQTELATMVGIADATAQRAIRDLKDLNLIRTGYRRIVVVDIPGLVALSNRRESR